MYNDIFTVFGLTVHGYGLMIGIGTAIAMFWSQSRAKKKGLSDDLALSGILWALLFGWSCAKLLYIITIWDSFLRDPLGALGGEGFVVYGGIVGGVLGVWLCCKKNRVSFPAYADVLIPTVAQAQGFGRLGCFLAGCCYGKACNSPLSVVFPAGSFAPAGVPLLPTQLFSAAADFLLAFILVRIDRRSTKDGLLMPVYLMLYSVGRFLIEFLRDDPRGSVGALSTSQFIAVPMFLLALLWYRKSYAGKAAGAQTE